MSRIVRWIERKWNNASIRFKLMVSFFFPIILILVINTYMYANINNMIVKVDEIYLSNVKLNELSTELGAIQNSVKEFLESKSTSALNEYYKSEQEYRDSMVVLQDSNADTSIRIMQNNILNQSDEYLRLITETVMAKRGRNVEKYKANFEQSEVVYADLQNCIFALNNARFKSNTENYNALLSSLRYIEIVTISILVIVGLINFVVLLFITRSMTNPIVELSRAANDVASGNFDVEVDAVESEDEIGVVSRAFIKMIDSIQEYITTIKDSMHRESELKEHELVMASRMKEVELNLLQAQINPHFLFNTLNAGAQLAMMEGADKTTEFIQVMAEFFRYSIKKIDSDTTIEQEVSLVDRYVYILNVRFTGEIHYSKHVDPDVGNIKIPSIVLQPIVENAINHGIRGIDREGHVDLDIYKKDDLVYISVKDNGIGMTEKQIDTVLNGDVSTEDRIHDADSNGVGLANVIERLQIFTGRKDVCEIHSEGINKGTEFIIKVPMHV